MWQKLTLTIAAVMPLAGCASSIGAGGGVFPVPAVALQAGQSNVFGTAASSYTLFSVDGHSLPYARASGDVAIAPAVILSGSLTLQPTGAFSISTTYREELAEGERLVDGNFGGSCAPEGSGYRMYWDGGGDSRLTVSGDTAIVNNDGVLFRYLKRR